MYITVFRIPARVSVPPTTGLNIFTSKDTEFEGRALLLKRLAFVIWSSEPDQFYKFITNIQGMQYMCYWLASYIHITDKRKQFSCKSNFCRTSCWSSKNAKFSSNCSRHFEISVPLFPSLDPQVYKFNCIVANNDSRNCTGTILPHFQLLRRRSILN